MLEHSVCVVEESGLPMYELGLRWLNLADPEGKILEEDQGKDAFQLVCAWHERVSME